MIPDLVHCDSDVTVTTTAWMTHRCPYVNEVDQGRVTVTWRVDGATYELHSLGAYLDTYRDAEISHEALTDRIAHDLGQPGVTDLTVTSTWTTAGMEITCSTTPTLAGQP